MLFIHYRGNIPQQRFYSFGVQQNNKANKITFMIDSSQDGLDIGGLTPYLKVKDKEGKYADKILLTDVDFTAEGMLYVWTMERVSTAYRNLEVQLQFEDEDEDIVWQTLIAEIELNNTIDVDQLLIDTQPQVLRDIYDKLDDRYTKSEVNNMLTNYVDLTSNQTITGLKSIKHQLQFISPNEITNAVIYLADNRTLTFDILNGTIATPSIRPTETERYDIGNKLRKYRNVYAVTGDFTKSVSAEVFVSTKFYRNDGLSTTTNRGINITPYCTEFIGRNDAKTLRVGMGFGQYKNIHTEVEDYTLGTATYPFLSTYTQNIGNANRLLAVDDIQEKLIAGTGIIIEGNVISSVSGGGGAWGYITGNIQDQTDLMEKFNNVEGDIADETSRAEQVEGQLEGRIGSIEGLIPAQATAQNQLADKDFVNSSIATNTAYFKGTYNVVTDLGLTLEATHGEIATALLTEVIDPTNNDYVFVSYPDPTVPSEYTKFSRYKYSSATQTWAFEFDLNNSTFTAQQWASINSGITAEKIANFVTLDGTQEISGEKTIANAVPLKFAGTYTGQIVNQENQLRFKYGGSDKLKISTANITSSAHLIPNSGSTFDLGTSTYKWRSAYIDTTNSSKLNLLDPNGVSVSETAVSRVPNASTLRITTAGTTTFQFSTSGNDTFFNLYPHTTGKTLGLTTNVWATTYTYEISDNVATRTPKGLTGATSTPTIESNSVELPYDTIAELLLDDDTTITLPTTTGCLPEYKANITNSGESSIVITFPSGTIIETNDTNITISNNTMTLPTSTSVELNLQNGHAIVFNWDI